MDEKEIGWQNILYKQFNDFVYNFGFFTGIIMNKYPVAYKSTCILLSSTYGTISINESRNVISFGKNANGFLGHDYINKVYLPTQIPNLNNMKMLDCGLYHTACIDYEGTLFIFGRNDNGQLGVDKQSNSLPLTHIPQKIINIPSVNYVACGYKFTICVTKEGEVYSFGNNKYGQLGLGNYKSYSSPQLIPDLHDVEFLECGEYHVICKTYSNEYYSWGNNHYGQLGQGNVQKSCNKPFKCLHWPEDIVDIKTGDNHSLILTLYGYVYSFGSNCSEFYFYCGQLGLDDWKINSVNNPTLVKQIPLIKRIAKGCFYSMCIDINDKLWVFGSNRYGQLGLGDDRNRYKPTLNESLHDISDISSTGNTTFVKTIKNEIYAFGNNKYLQLGIKTPKNKQLSPILLFKDAEDIWGQNIFKSKMKSARK